MAETVDDQLMRLNSTSINVLSRSCSLLLWLMLIVNLLNQSECIQAQSSFRSFYSLSSCGQIVVRVFEYARLRQNDDVGWTRIRYDFTTSKQNKRS